MIVIFELNLNKFDKFTPPNMCYLYKYKNLNLSQLPLNLLTLSSLCKVLMFYLGGALCAHS